MKSFSKRELPLHKVLNHLIQMENGVTDVLKILRDKREISIEQFKDLSPSSSRPGVLYSLAKVHKIFTDGFPSFTPILRAIYTQTYKFVKLLVPMQEPPNN